MMKCWHQSKSATDEEAVHLTLATNQPIPTVDESTSVLVKVHSAGVNPIDYKRATGFSIGIDFPSTPGVDGSGIAQNDSADGRIKKGDAVMFHTNFSGAHGSFGEYAVATTQGIFKKPEALSFAEAAAVPCAGYTAALAIFHYLDVKPANGDVVFINGGSGGVGAFAIQLAKAAGASKVIATCSARNIEFVEGLGATAIDYTADVSVHGTVLDRCKKITGATDGSGGIDKFFDTVCHGPDCGSAALPFMKFNGRIAFVLPFFLPHGDVAVAAFVKNLTFSNILLGGMFTASPQTTAICHEVANRCNQLLQDKKVRVPIAGEVGASLEEGRNQLAASLTGRTVGKLVFNIEQAVAAE